jgi:hypothetical protein
MKELLDSYVFEVDRRHTPFWRAPGGDQCTGGNWKSLPQGLLQFTGAGGLNNCDEIREGVFCLNKGSHVQMVIYENNSSLVEDLLYCLLRISDIGGPELASPLLYIPLIAHGCGSLK